MSDANDQAVILDVECDPPPADGLLAALEADLSKALRSARAGMVDGTDVSASGTTVTIYMYGPCADELYAAVESLLRAHGLLTGARVELRYGPPDRSTPRAIRWLP